MKPTRLFTHSLKAIGRYKLRTGFMMLGTLVGVAALTLVLSVGEAAQRKVLATVRQMFGDTSILLTAGTGRMMGALRAGGARLTIEDVEAVAKQIPAIEAWDPQRILPSANLRHGEANSTARVSGVSERYEKVWNRSLTQGDYFDAAAVAGSARVALIGETVVRKLFGTEDPMGAELTIDSVQFRVIGILEPLGTDAHGMDRDDEVLVPISTAMRRLANADTIQMARLLIRDPGQVTSTASELQRALRERHSLGEGQPDDFMLITPVQVQRMVTQFQRIMFLYLPLVAGISLLAGAVVAASLMLASVNARVREIGLRRAVGARPQDIRLQFLIETAVTTLTGGLAGLALGCGVAEFVAARMSLGDVVSPRAIAVGLVSAAVTGLVAGVLPARRAAALMPVDALR